MKKLLAVLLAVAMFVLRRLRRERTKHPPTPTLPRTAPRPSIRPISKSA